MSGETTPRSKLDFIYQEVVGEVAVLVARMEAVAATLDEVSRSRAAERTVEALEHAAAASASRVRAELERAGELARRRLSMMVSEMSDAAEASTTARRWRALALTAAVALVGSFVGGVVVVLVHHAGWW